MKVTYKLSSNPKQEDEPLEPKVIDDSNTSIESREENRNEELSDKFLYGYLITCGVIITVLKIIT